MATKKKLIWWEREPMVASAAQARRRGAQDGPGRRGGRTSPYYGPVHLQVEGDEPSCHAAVSLRVS